MNVTLNILAYIFASVILIPHSIRGITILQQKNYRLEKNSFTIKKERLLFYLKGCIATVILTAVTKNGQWYTVLGLMFVFTLFLACPALQAIRRTKVPLKYTNRTKRLFAAYFTAIIILFYLTSLLPSSTYVILVVFAAIAFNALLLDIVCFTIGIFEKANNQRYISAAKRRLAASSMYKIGITGSYGKTSTKYILVAMLEKKYKVLSTQANYNTPLGIALTLKDKNLNRYEIFVAEMGARYKGDIAKLVDIVVPLASITTPIGEQHLSTFKNIDTIIKEKSKLPLGTKEYCVMDIDNQYCASIYKQINCKKAAISIKGTENASALATNIKITNNLTFFDIEFIDGVKLLGCTTKLLGGHNISNILQGATLARYLKVDLASIKVAIATLEPISHRLQLVDNTRGITIIDDTYNANFEGVKSAYDVLGEFVGRKVVLTQGIAELGSKSAEINCKVGQLLAHTADIVMLTGVNAEYIKEGLLSQGFVSKNIKQYESLAHAQADFGNILAKGDVFLLQNDLIDIS